MEDTQEEEEEEEEDKPGGFVEAGSDGGMERRGFRRYREGKREREILIREWEWKEKKDLRGALPFLCLFLSK